MATKKRLIDANALMQEIESKINWGQNNNVAVLEAIDDAPTVDAVEVVRCKDCKNNIREAKWSAKDGEHHTVLCLYRKGFKIWHSPDDFCSCGERRIENDNK